jgi:hypothetical protein
MPTQKTAKEMEQKAEATQKTAQEKQQEIGHRSAVLAVWSKVVESGIFGFFATQKWENFLFHSAVHIGAFPVMVGMMVLQAGAAWMNVYYEAKKPKVTRILLAAVGNALAITTIAVGAVSGLILTLIGIAALAAVGSFLFVGAMSGGALFAGYHAIKETGKAYKAYKAYKKCYDEMNKDQDFITKKEAADKATKSYLDIKNDKSIPEYEKERQRDIANNARNKFNEYAKQLISLEKAYHQQRHKAARAWINVGLAAVMVVAILFLMVISAGAASLPVAVAVIVASAVGGALAVDQTRDETIELEELSAKNSDGPGAVALAPTTPAPASYAAVAAAAAPAASTPAAPAASTSAAPVTPAPASYAAVAAAAASTSVPSVSRDRSSPFTFKQVDGAGEEDAVLSPLTTRLRTSSSSSA